MTRLGFLILFAISAAACGDKTPAPSPTAPAPTITPTSLSIAGSETLRTGQAQTYTATVNMSNGTSQAASPTWTSDNQSVLTITSSGAANAVAQGTATLSAVAQGVNATRLVSVWQDYQGTWTGSYRVRVCTEQGNFVGLLCRDTFRVGTSLPLIVTLTQNGPSASGTAQLGNLVNSLSGGIFASRRFVGGGSGTFSSDGLTLNSRVGTFDALSSASGLAGTIIITLTVDGFVGNTYLEADLSGVTRTSTLAQPGRTPNYRSLQELFGGFRGE